MLMVEEDLQLRASRDLLDSQKVLEVLVLELKTDETLISSAFSCVNRNPVSVQNLKEILMIVP